MQTTGLSGASIARTLGLSTGTISLVKNDKTESVSEENLQRINDFIDSYQVKSTVKAGSDVVETSDLKMVQFICEETIYSNEMGVIYGNAGTGKTIAAKRFVANRPDAVIIETVPGMSTKSLLIKILDQQGSKNAIGTVEQLLDLAVNNFKKSEQFLLIDEAENLTTKSLEAIRRIHDFSNVPAILIGTYALIQNLKGRQGELLQLYSRISNKWEMKGLNDDDRNALFGDLGQHIRRFTADIRRSMSIFRKAQRFSQLSNESLDVKHIKLATQSVILD